MIKGDGGAIGLTEDPSALRRWMVAGPKVSRLEAGYEAMSGMKDATYSSRQHEQTLSAHKSFFENVKSLSAVMQEMYNPFQEESADLLVLDTKTLQTHLEPIWLQHITSGAKSSSNHSWTG